MMKFLHQYPDVLATMSLKGDGNMKITDPREDREIISNRRSFCVENNIPYKDLISALVAHGTDVAIVDDVEKTFYKDKDALVTKQKGIYIALTVADCFPVFFYEPKSGIVAIAHAGWRGVVKGIVGKTIGVMIEQGADPREIRVVLGPGISQANFEFHFKEMIREFGHYSQDKYITKGSSLDKVKINLQQMILDQAEEYGVISMNINYCAECTFDDDGKFFSARRHNGESFSAMLCVIGMIKE